MFAISFCFSADANEIGKVDFQSISDQVCLELLVTDMNARQDFVDDRGDFLDITAWSGVFIGESGRVQSIDWSMHPYHQEEGGFRIATGGCIAIQWVPPEVTFFRVPRMELAGTIETEKLPRRLHTLAVGANLLAGTFQISTLPDKLHTVNISNNRFSGPLDLVNLPQSMITFYASTNSFSGTLDFSSLPECLASLSLDTNSFTGDIDMSTLPHSLQSIDLFSNMIEQRRLVVGKKRNTFCNFRIDRKKFGKVVFKEKPVGTQPTKAS